MNDFYVQDLDFGSAHNPLQAPVFLSWVAASQGFVPPDPGRPFSYCDLGCGNGVTLNGLAAVHPESRFVGIDFNQGHIEQARRLAGAVGIGNAEFHLASFSELASLGLPPFDFIGMNGVYSWLHPGVVQAAIGFLSSNLVPSGLFVVEYLTLPGAAAVAPMWKLMREITSHLGGGPAERAAKGLETLAKLRHHNARYFIDNPRQSGHVEQLHQRRDDEGLLSWLAHSSLADHWHPKYFTEVSEELGTAGLRFAGSAHLALNHLELSIPLALRGMFEELREEGQVELLKDFVLNRSQRTDVFIKDAEREPSAADRFRREELRIAACVGKREALATVTRMGRAVQADEKALCLDLVDRLCETGRPVSLADLEADERAITRLLLTGLLHVYGRKSPPPIAEPGASGTWTFPLELNLRNLEEAATALEPTALVITNGGCARLSGLEALVLWAHVRHADDDARRDLVHSSIRDHTGAIHVGGQVTTSKWITAGQISEAMHDFEEQRLPILARLGIVVPEKGTPPSQGDQGSR